MKVYIAGPMTGLQDKNRDAFDVAETLLKARGLDPVNPFKNEADSRVFRTDTEMGEWVHYMRLALAQVIEADAVCLLPGWERSQGATLERRVALELRIYTKPLDEWMALERQGNTRTEDLTEDYRYGGKWITERVCSQDRSLGYLRRYGRPSNPSAHEAPFGMWWRR